MAQTSKLVQGAKVYTYTKYYPSGTLISGVDVFSTESNTTRWITQKRLKPLDLLHNKTGISHFRWYRNYSFYSGQNTSKMWKKSVHQSANLSKDLTLDCELEGTNDLDNRLRNKLKGDMANLGQMLAEYNKTAQLFGDLAGQVADLYRAARGRYQPKPRSRWTPKGGHSKAAARKYLQFQYGVVPLGMDMTDSINAMYSAGLRMPELQATVGRTMYGEKSTITLYEPTTGIVRKVYNNYSCRRTVRKTAICTVDYDLLLSTLGRTGLTNPFSLAYELVPFSFVLDWWINVGDVLASLDNILFFGAITVQTSEKTIWSKRSTVDGASGSFIQSNYTRSAPYSLSPINTFAYKPSVSLRHILNGTALLRSLL